MADLLSPPIKTLSGYSKSFTAEPYARNSGLRNTSNVLLLSSSGVNSATDFRIDLITTEVLTAKVHFSTTIVYPFE